MNFFIRHIKVNRDGVLTMLVFQTGLFILGVIMVACINAFLNDTQDYANIGGLSRYPKANTLPSLQA